MGEHCQNLFRARHILHVVYSTQLVDESRLVLVISPQGAVDGGLITWSCFFVLLFNDFCKANSLTKATGPIFTILVRLVELRLHMNDLKLVF